MKIKVIVLLVAILLVICSEVMADKVTILKGNGNAYTVSEFDTSGTGTTSSKYYSKNITSAAANPATGEVVIGFTNGTAAVVDYNHLGTIIASGTIGSGSNVLSVAIRPNGELYFANVDGWAYARSHTNVTAVPSGYTLPANLQFIPLHDPCLPAPPPYLTVMVNPQDKAIFVSTDAKQTNVRQGNDMNSVPSGYVNSYMEWDRIITACRTLSTGDVVLATGTATGTAQVFIRDDANMAAAPAGYVGDGTTFGTGARIVALAVSKKDYVVIGNDSGQVFVRKASDLTQSVIPGFASTSTSDMAAYNGIAALAVTSNNNVVIALYDGRVYVRSLFDIDGADICPMTTRYSGGSPVIAAVVVSKTETITLTCADVIARGSVMDMDLNEDCYIGFEDFAMIALNWTKCNDPQNGNCQE
ncbi:MAG: hypothetical protein ACYC3B_09170 [Sedimentisphaerales bacterium]